MSSLTRDEIRTTLKTLISKGLTFSHCISAFGVDTDTNPYASNAPSKDGETEIDSTTVVSEGEGGAYVMAWVWVSDVDVWTGPTTHDGEPCRFINHYECSECGTAWSDQWSCACNDECPQCGAGDIEPHESNELDIEGNIIKED